MVKVFCDSYAPFTTLFSEQKRFTIKPLSPLWFATFNGYFTKFLEVVSVINRRSAFWLLRRYLLNELSFECPVSLLVGRCA